jgi:hypothetical protein
VTASIEGQSDVLKALQTLLTPQAEEVPF